ncbi:MAG: hypothetical protein JXM69_00840 [Anaerolineae bacterium]|nr:hypothetical protein [Anaerolineae bacterium]
MVPITKLNDFPILHLDYSYHYAQIVEINELFTFQGTSWGYSPLFFAGYPVGITSNLGAKGWTWFVYLLSYFSIPAVTAFNLFVVWWLVVTPLLIYQSSRWFSLSPGVATLATILGMFYWWVSVIYIYFILYGMVSFAATIPLAMFGIAAFVAFIYRRRWFYLGVMGVTVTLCGWLHILSAIFIVVGVGVVYLFNLRRLSLIQHGAILLIGALAVIAQWPWLGPYLSIGKWFAGSDGHEFFFQANGFAAIRRDILSELPLASLHRLVLVGSVVGLYQWWQKGKYSLAALFTILPATLLFLGYFGSVLAKFQPERNLPVAYLWLTIPAVVGGQYVYNMLRQNNHRCVLTIAGLILLILTLWPNLPEFSERAIEEFGRPYTPGQLIHPPSDNATILINWLQANTTQAGRVLFEESTWYWDNQTQVVAGYLAYASQRSFIGGPFPWGGPVDFVDGHPFDRPIETMTTFQMADYLSLYNIHWVIVYSEESQTFFDGRPELVEPLQDLSFAKTYRVKSPGNYFLTGTGQVKVEGHRIKLWDLQGSEIVLKYHWVPYLQSDSEVVIEREMIASDPHGFIKIVDPPEQITLWVDPQ